ncbi:hypothetical protein BV898_09689 [Hypsibius exemplaris]|uniref:Uncharacterized protein n=1 Tax=Hypsibius exemplaris TaxID=2072580 RepID=A0A1W0WLX6_HYPEX|nr:hypothetical protein BV898_09689 [Hypsibius exemplaris]
MQSSSVRAVARLAPLISLSKTLPASYNHHNTGCRYLRGTPRSAPASKLRSPLATESDQPREAEPTAAGGGNSLNFGEDWRPFSEETTTPRRGSHFANPFSAALEPVTSDTRVETGEATDLLMEKIKRSGALDSILELTRRHEKIMNHHHLAAVVEQLFDQIVKRDQLSDLRKRELLQDPRFATLCTRLLRSHRFMSPSATMNILKLVSILNVPSESRIVQTFLHLLKESINDLRLDGLMYSAFLLSKFPSNRLAEALSIAVPIAFEMRFHKEMDPDDLHQLTRMLTFCTSFNVSRSTKASVLQSLQRRLLRDRSTKDNMQLHEAAQLFVKFERGNIREPKLLNFVFDVLERGDLNILHSGTAKQLGKSLRWMRAKHPEDFPPGHRIFSLEKKVSHFFPPPADADSASFFALEDHSSETDNDHSGNDRKNK